MSFSHRSGSLKQRNKRHKSEPKRSDSLSTRGSRKSIRRLLNKQGRRATAKQKRFFTVSTLKRILDGRGILGAPFWCVLLPITSTVPVNLAVKLLQKADPDAEITNETEKNLQRVVYMRCPSLDKHFAIVSAKPDDIFACIDLIHIADWVVLLIPSDCNELDAKTESFLTSIYAQGMGDVSFAVMSPDFNSKDIKKKLLSRFPIPENAIYPLNNPDQAAALLRHVTLSRKKVELFKRTGNCDTYSVGRFRAKMLVDDITLTSTAGSHIDSDNSNSLETYLKIQGLLRGAPLYFDDPLERLADEKRRPFIYLTGWGDFPLAAATWKNKDTTTQHWSASSLGQHLVKIRDNLLRSSSVTNGSIYDTSEGTDSAELPPPKEKNELAISEDESPDRGDIEDSDTFDDDPMSVAEDNESRDMSAYCSRTLVSSRLSTYSLAQLTKFREARAEELYPDEVETPQNVPARIRFAKYRSLPNFQNSVWPFDKDQLPNQYDNIACFKHYHHNRRSIIRYLTERCQDTECNQGLRPNCIPPDVQANLTLGPINQDLALQIISRHATTSLDSPPPPPLIAWSLLPHENRISVCHFTMRRVLPALCAKSDLVVIALAANKSVERSESVTLEAESLELGEEASTQAEQTQEMILNALSEHRRKKASIRRSVYNPMGPCIPPEAEPIKSKELMVFQAGIRRFISAPIYSTQTTHTHEKAKYEPFFPATHAGIVASVYAPVMYSPVNALQFRIRVDEDEDGKLSRPYVAELVATGTLQSVDPSRLIVKRIFLSGHPYKIRRHHAVVRFMFFNPLDVEYFKTVRLQTKSGISGHIEDSIGTHGAMKCIFERQLKASDVILMPLYKRIFPKWVYQPTIIKVLKASLNVPPAVVWQQAPDTLQLTKKKTTVSVEEDSMTLEGMDMFD